MGEALFKIGDRVQALGNKARGIVTGVIKWNNPDGYQGYVYEFRNGYGRVFFGYKENQIDRVQ